MIFTLTPWKSLTFELERSGFALGVIPEDEIEGSELRGHGIRGQRSWVMVSMV